MSNLLFPDLPGITWQVTWSPMFKTRIQTTVSGKEYRQALMANPIYKLTLSYEFLRHGARDELRALVGLFHRVRGSFDNFLFQLPDDCSVTDHPFAVGDGKTKSYQLMRAFGSGSPEPVQNIEKITNIKIGNSVTGGYTVSDKGVITFPSAPTGPLKWTGRYYYRVRFEHDSQDFEQFMLDLWSAKKVGLIGSLGTRI